MWFNASYYLGFCCNLCFLCVILRVYVYVHVSVCMCVFISLSCWLRSSEMFGKSLKALGDSHFKTMRNVASYFYHDHFLAETGSHFHLMINACFVGVPVPLPMIQKMPTWRLSPCPWNQHRYVQKNKKMESTNNWKQLLSNNRHHTLNRHTTVTPPGMR